MTPDTDPAPTIGCAYEEFEVGSETVAMIQRVDNEHAWLQSTLTVAVRR
jgi:hypothetical protein